MANGYRFRLTLFWEVVGISVNVFGRVVHFCTIKNTTDHIETYMHKDGKSLSFPIKVDHVKYWGQFWEPVILTVWDAKSNITYWEVIQDYLQVDKSADSSKKTNLRVQIPTTNILDEKGLYHILTRTKERFERFEITSDVVEILKNLLKEYSNVEVDYEPGNDVLIVRKPSGEMDWTFFGEIVEQFQSRAMEHKVELEQLIKAIFKGFFYDMAQRPSGESTMEWLIKSGFFYEEFTETGRVFLRYWDGRLFKIYETIDEWNRAKQKS